LELDQIIKNYHLDFIGDRSINIECLSSIENPKPNSIVLVTRKYFDQNLNLDNLVVLTSIEYKENINCDNIMISDNPQLTFAKLSANFAHKSKLCSHPANFISPSSGITMGQNVVIEENVLLGNNVFIDHNVIIHKNCIIGNNVIIGSGSIIGAEGFGNVKDDLGKWVHIHHNGKVIIGNDVSIGSNCCIDRGTLDDTIINDGVIIDNLVHIAHNVNVGEYTAIAAKTGIAGSCIIGKRNMIGGMVGIVDHIKTANDVIISATSTVNKDIIEPGTYTGIMPISNHTNWKRIALWITKLDKIAKFLNLKRL